MANKMLTFCSAGKQNSTISVRPEDIVALYKAPNGTCGFMVRGDGDIQGMGHRFDDVKALLEKHGVEFVDCGLPFVSEDTAKEKAPDIQRIITEPLANAGVDISGSNLSSGPNFRVGTITGRLAEPVLPETPLAPPADHELKRMLSETPPAPPADDDKPQD
jgi:hypothetical protein